MADFDAGSIEAHLDLDRTAFTAGLAEARRQANALSRESPSVRVDADTRAAETKLDILKAKLIALSSKTYHVGVDVAQHGGTGILSGLKLAGLAGIGAAASSLAPEILGISSALGVAATGVGAFAAVAIPEFKEIGLSADQLKKKHEALTPPLEKADAAFAKLKTTYQQLQAATSGPVFGLASQAFIMLSQVLPSLAPLITSTASGLSGVVSQLGAAFSGSGFKQFLAFAQSNIGPTLNSLTSSLISFGSGFASMLERANPLAGIFLSQIKDLADGTKNLGKSNAFASFVQAAQPVMATLGQAIGLLLTNLGRVVTALLPAAQPVLEFIGNLAKAIGDMVQGAGPALAKLFQGMVGPLTVLVDTLGPAVDTVLGALAPVFDQVLAALVPIVPVLGQLIAQLLPPLADLLSQVVAAVAPLIPSLGQLLLALVPVAQLMIQQLGPIIPIIVSGLVSLIVPIANFLSTLNPAVILGIVAAVAALAAIFFGGPTSIVIAIAAAATLISSHWSQITGAFSAAIGWINGVFKAAWALVEKYIVDPVVAAYNAVVHWLQSVINWVTGTLWPWLKTWGPVALALLAPFIGIPLLIYQHFNQIIGWLQGVWGHVEGGVEAMIGWVRSHFDSLVGFVEGIPGRIGSALASLAGLLLHIASTAMQNMLNGFTTAFNNVITFFAGLGSRIVGAIGDIGSSLYNIGVNVMNGLWNGLKNTWGKVTGWLKHLNPASWFNDINLEKGHAEVNMLPTGMAVMGGLQSGMMRGWDNVTSWLSTLNPSSSFGASNPVFNTVGNASSSGGVGPGSGPVNVRVYIGDRELTHIVRTEVDNGFTDTLIAYQAGAY